MPSANPLQTPTPSVQIYAKPFLISSCRVLQFIFYVAAFSELLSVFFEFIVGIFQILFKVNYSLCISSHAPNRLSPPPTVKPEEISRYSLNYFGLPNLISISKIRLYLNCPNSTLCDLACEFELYNPLSSNTTTKCPSLVKNLITQPFFKI